MKNSIAKTGNVLVNLSNKTMYMNTSDTGVFTIL